MADIYDVFNTKLVEFIDDVSHVYKNSKQIKAGINLAIMMDRKFPIKTFHSQVVLKYGEQIKTRDEAFLLEEDYSKSIENMPPNAASMDIVNDLKTIWKSLDDDSKNAIWAHMQGLCTLAAHMSRRK